MLSKKSKKKLLIAMIIGAVFAFAIYDNLKKTKIPEPNFNIPNNANLLAQKLPVQAPPKLVKVVAVKNDQKAGTKLTADMIEIKEIGLENAPKDSFSDINAVIDKVVSKNVLANEILIASIVQKSKNLPIPVDMRSITIPIEYIQGLSSYISVESKVDIISASKEADAMPPLILQNTKIISLESSQGSFTDNSISIAQASAITFEIPAKFASRLVKAMIDGKLQIICRGLGDNKIISEGGSSPASKKITIPPPPFDIESLKNRGFNTLPEPAAPFNPTPKKVEIIQSNVKSELTFDNDL
ncbi:MAG: Flp pilus assembly protein CpaB [bacterium]